MMENGCGREYIGGNLFIGHGMKTQKPDNETGSKYFYNWDKSRKGGKSHL